MKSRRKIILVIGITVLIFAALFSLYGYDNTFRLWNVPVMSPHFADIRALTAGSESYRQGLDPMDKNPADPWGRITNLPRIWHGLYWLGLNQSHTALMGGSFILLFLIGVCLFLPNARNTTILMVLAAVLSPAVLLGAERGSVDLLMFFLVSAAIVAAQRSYALSTFAILSGFTLKFFPIFGLAVLLKANRAKFIRYALIALIFAGCYIFLTFSDILLIKRHMPECRIGYGMSLYWRILGDVNVNLGRCSKGLSYLLLMLSSLFAFSALFRKDGLPGAGRERGLS